MGAASVRFDNHPQKGGGEHLIASGFMTCAADFAPGGGMAGSRNLFRCSDGITELPYEVIGKLALKVTSCSFVVIHDFFDTLDAARTSKSTTVPWTQAPARAVPATVSVSLSTSAASTTRPRCSVQRRFVGPVCGRMAAPGSSREIPAAWRPHVRLTAATALSIVGRLTSNVESSTAA